MALSPEHAPVYVGVDVGGTNMKAGVVDDTGRPLSKVSLPTDAALGPETGLNNIARVIDLALKQAGLTMPDIRGVGLATPGTMDIPSGMLLDPPNLPGWRDFPIRDRLAEKLQCFTVLQNDANAAAYGEYWAGAARDAQSLVFWTLGTGVGCGIIYENTIIEGAHSTGAECGHIIVEMQDGRLLPGTGQYGTLEAYTGSKAIVQRCQEALASGRPSSLRERLAAGGELTPLVIAEAAEAGDSLADDLIMETARYLGAGTTTVMHTIDPEIVLFGGQMTFGGPQHPLGQKFLAEIRREVHRRTFPVLAAKTRIEFASLGPDAGYIGAAGCARMKFGDK